MQLEYGPVEQFLKGTLLLGAAIMAVAYGIRRVYRIARNIDTLVEHAKGEEERDRQVRELAAQVAVIFREVMPNGGSSMKDVVNQTNQRVNDIHARVAVLEQWKEDVAP